MILSQQGHTQNMNLHIEQYILTLQYLSCQLVEEKNIFDRR